jgi:hypothetical protein
LEKRRENRIRLNDHAQQMKHKDDVIQFKDTCIQQQIQMHSMQLEAARSEANMKVRQKDLDCQAAIHAKDTTIASMTREIASLQQALKTANQNQGLSNNCVDSQAAIDKDKLIEDQRLEIARLQRALTIALENQRTPTHDDIEFEAAIGQKDIFIEQKSREIAHLKQALEAATQNRGVQQSRDDDSVARPPVGNVYVNDNMDLDTVTASECFIKRDAWLPKWRNMNECAEIYVKPDKFMFRMWLGIPNRAAQAALENDEILELFRLLRQYDFADQKMAPYKHGSNPELQKLLSHFTGFQV